MYTRLRKIILSPDSMPGNELKRIYVLTSIVLSNIKYGGKVNC